MGAFVIVSGTIFREVKSFVSRNGKPFATATLKVRNGDAVEWWKIVAFSETACAELARLGEGDSLSAQGVLKIETYEKDGQTRISPTVIADAILPLRRPKEKPARSDATARRPHQGRTRAERAVNGEMRAYAGPADSDLDDALPF